MKELIFVLVAFWNTPATLDNGKCSACGRRHVISTVVMAAVSSCTAMYCGSGYYAEQGAFHAPRPATRARSTGNAAVDTGLSYRASNELFQRFPENVTEKGGNDLWFPPPAGGQIANAYLAPEATQSSRVTHLPPGQTSNL